MIEYQLVSADSHVDESSDLWADRVPARYKNRAPTASPTVTQMMWSGDFPPGGSDWPNSRTAIEDHFDGVPDNERHAILAGNVLRIYGYKAAP